MAKSTAAPDLMVRVVADAPPGLKERDTRAWRKGSACWAFLSKVNKMSVDGELTPEQKEVFSKVVVYWMEHFPVLPSKIINRLQKHHYRKMGITPKQLVRLSAIHKFAPAFKAKVCPDEPRALIDFDPNIWFNSPYRSARISVMSYLYLAVYAQPEMFLYSDASRYMVAHYLSEFPEFIEEITSVRPEFLQSNDLIQSDHFLSPDFVTA